MRRAAGNPLLAAAALFTLVLLVAPLAVVVAISFTASAMLEFPPDGFSLRWYAKILEQPEFLHATITSLQLAVASAAVSVLLGTTAAIGIRRHSFPGRAAVEGLLLSPLMLPQLVLAIALLMYLSRLGLSSSFLGLWLGHVLVTTPYVVRLVLVSLERVDPNIERAARIAGASPMRAAVGARVDVPRGSSGKGEPSVGHCRTGGPAGQRVKHSEQSVAIEGTPEPRPRAARGFPQRHCAAQWSGRFATTAAAWAGREAARSR